MPLALAVLVFCTACRQALAPVSTAVPTPTSRPPTAVPQPTEEPELQAEIAKFGGGFAPLPYAVVWTSEGIPLTVRQPAGITSMAVAELAIDQRGVAITGNTTQLGSSTWVEIVLGEGASTGWVNGWNLTEDIPQETFCGDARISDLANRFILALQSESGAQIAQLVSPRRGLIIRHDWWNPEVAFELSGVTNLFDDQSARTWGVNKDSKEPIEGSYSDVIQPQLEDVFSIAPQVECNALALGETGNRALWPEEYTNLNYVAFHRPAPEPGSALNWRTWVMAIEYVEGHPYLALLVQYRGEI